MFFLILERPCAVAIDHRHSHSKLWHEQVLDKSYVFHEQFIENQIAGQAFHKHCCSLSFEGEVTKRGIKHVGTEGGKGEEFKT